MITVTVEQCRLAYTALRRIGETVSLGQKAAWRSSRIQAALKPVIVSFEETQLKIFLDAGGTQSGAGVQIESITRGKDETDPNWQVRQNAYRLTVNKLQADLRTLNKEKVEIDCEPLPLSLFKDDTDAKDKKPREFLPNDFTDLGPFIIDDEEPKPVPKE